MKLPDRASLYVIDRQPVFFQTDNGAVLIPHLKLVHRFPEAFPTVRIDRGAIRFVLSGATLMAPGLTSQGGRLPRPHERTASRPRKAYRTREPTRTGTGAGSSRRASPSWSWQRGRRRRARVGVLVAGTKEVKEKGKGPVIEEAHFLGDGLWNLNVELGLPRMTWA